MADLPYLFANQTDYLLCEIREPVDDSTVVFDQRRQVIHANAAAQHAFSKNVHGKAMLELVPEDKRKQFEHILTALKNSDHHSVELQGDLSFSIVLQEVTCEKALLHLGCAERDVEESLGHATLVGDFPLTRS